MPKAVTKPTAKPVPKPTPKPAPKSSHEDTHITFFREVLHDVRRIMAEKYGLRHVSIRPIKSDASRLSIPVKITGTNAKGEPVRYFGKILGSNDLLSARSIQFFKNIYLQMHAEDPIFGFTETAEEMARQQDEVMRAIHDAGIPTATPLGFHWINGLMWLLVAEFLDSRAISDGDEVTAEQLDLVFGYLKRLHSRRVFHGDIKPDNIRLGAKIYILDAGVFRDKVPAAKKQAYDLACLLCSFVDRPRIEETVSIARRHYSHQNLVDAGAYVNLIQQRLDFHFNNTTKMALTRAMNA